MWEKLDQVAHDKLFAVVSFQKLSQNCSVCMVRPRQISSYVHEFLDFLWAEGASQVVIPSSK
jgi:hypothetical protein